MAPNPTPSERRTIIRRCITTFRRNGLQGDEGYAGENFDLLATIAQHFDALDQLIRTSGTLPKAWGRDNHRRNPKRNPLPTS